MLQLAHWLRAAQHVVVHTGAGISTSCGIPDFRGPKGVWTLESRGEQPPDTGIDFDSARPGFTHRCAVPSPKNYAESVCLFFDRALVALEAAGVVQAVVTQNVDGLALRSGFPRNRLAVLHGDMFLERCHTCSTWFVRPRAVRSIGERPSGWRCTQPRRRKARSRRVAAGSSWHLDFFFTEMAILRAIQINDSAWVEPRSRGTLGLLSAELATPNTYIYI